VPFGILLSGIQTITNDEQTSSSVWITASRRNGGWKACFGAIIAEKHSGIDDLCIFPTKKWAGVPVNRQQPSISTEYVSLIDLNLFRDSSNPR
jgi:hypothetical protein